MSRVGLVVAGGWLALLVLIPVGQEKGGNAWEAEEPDVVNQGPTDLTVRPARPSAVETPRADRPGAVGTRVSRIYVPRIDLADRVYSSRNLNRGTSWWPVTGRPGGGDTVAIAGHRTTYTRPFYHLERLRRGDSIFVSWRGRTQEYRVSDSRVYPATNLHIGDARGYEILILSACAKADGSPTSGDYRLVVYAKPA